MGRRQRHQQFLIRHAAIAPLGKARQRQARLAGFQRPSPGIRAGGLADNAPFELLVAGILQPVDQDDHLPRRRIDQADIGRIEPAARKRTYRERVVLTERHDIERLLALACVFRRAMPDADIVLPREPFLVLRGKPDHGAALGADEVIGGDTHRPAEPRGHADDLVGGVDRARTPDFFDRLHILDTREHFHADHGGLQAKQVVQVGDHAGQIQRFARPLMLHGINSQIGASCF